MKTILGLDLGTNSIGWALVKEAENNEEKSSIISLGSRVIPLTTDEKTNFEKGKAQTTNAERTRCRSARRGNQRFKLRRERLIEILLREGWITKDTLLAECGSRTTFETLRLRAKAAREEISLEELARVLLMINKKRGYKSNRKTDKGDEGQAIDGLAVAKELGEAKKTPGQYVLERFREGKFQVPDFYKSDLMAEFDAIWNAQSSFYQNELTDELKDKLCGKDKRGTWAICKEHFDIVGIKRDKKGKELVRENYEWRVKALSARIGLEELTIVLQEINNQIQKSASYLGRISNRHKELQLNGITIGQYLVSCLDRNPNFSLKNTVFYRNDYIDEFEKVWNKQAEFHEELTEELKKEIGQATIFYQRPLKSQKGLVSLCEFENQRKEVVIDGKKVVKTIGLKACPKASPLFQEFKIWQVLNNLTVNGNPINQEQKGILFAELNRKQKLTKTEARKLLGCRRGDELNYDNIEGNSTNAAFFNAYCTILVNSGHDRYDLTKESAADAYKIIEEVFSSLGYKTDFLHFDVCKEGDEFLNQPAYRLWHLIYSYEGDNSLSGVDGLVRKISELTGLPEEHAKTLAQITFKPDYGNLSSKAIRKIMPHLMNGYKYSEACELAGYRHSKSSLTKDELDRKELNEHLDLLPKNSLRNPVVEKILNQMVNVVNTVIDTYGTLDEVRIELARELKKSAKERKEMTDGIANAEKQNEQCRKDLQKDFGIAEPTRNDIIKYRLYKELELLRYHTLYSDTYIPKEELFRGKAFEIEHIIPQSKLFDDSFSNKTLETSSANNDKDNSTAYDYVKTKYGEQGLVRYKNQVEYLYGKGVISRAKHDHLLMTEADIPDGFIDRDLRETQYIAKKAKAMLEAIVRSVVSTTGAVTDRLREDWQLINVMQELNWDKYDKLGLTETLQDKDGRRIPRIKNWTKRNDHRHHAMDALVIAFTKRSYIQYLNNLNARIPKSEADGEFVDLSEMSLSDLPFEERQRVVRSIENTQLERDGKGKLRFIPPMPVDEFRAEAKRHLASCLVSIKSKNKVVTRNVNKYKRSGTMDAKVELTPRGQLHKDTIYGKIDRYETNEETVGAAFDEAKIATVANKAYREALLKRLHEYHDDPRKAFTGKNNIDKFPVYFGKSHFTRVPKKVKTVQLGSRYIIRKAIDQELNVNQVVDEGIKRILRARLEKYNNDAARAFSNLDQDPIWLNEEKGIQIKKVKVFGIANAVALREKKDNVGNIILGKDGTPVPNDYVSTGNNHHVAIFEDRNGDWQEHVVSFYDAVQRANHNLPVIDKEYNKEIGWRFLFTMKQNEYFVFPNAETDFHPDKIDLLNPDNYKLISPNLYRVQKLATKYYVFRHHLETTVEDAKELRNTTWIRIQNVNGLKGIVKVRINHIGQIVSIGE